jgi:iron complex outermembrane receptor protein
MKMTNKRSPQLIPAVITAIVIASASQAEDNHGSNLTQMNLSDLMLQRTAVHRQSDTASSVSESLQNAPAAMIVIRQQDIRRRGYDSIDDILADLPGFDTVVTNGTEQVVSYQRGYRTPWTQRTLLLINGKVENNLWMHGAVLSRQYPMSHVDSIEILYGPSGAVYGPNAFLGVINIITKNNDKLIDGEDIVNIQAESGSFDSKAIELSLRGKHSDFGYSIGARLFNSDEAAIGDYSQWGYFKESLLRDPAVWGAGIASGDINLDGVISSNELFNDEPTGRYSDPSENYSLLADFYWRDWSMGLSTWRTDEGYGPYYSLSDAQPQGIWFHTADQFYLKNTHQLNDTLKITSELVYRENASGGDWVESYGSSLSISDWLSNNSAWRFEQQYDLQLTPNLLLSGGIKHEEKKLTKGYMVCNYFDDLGFCPAQASSSTGGLSSDGSGVIAVGAIAPGNTTPLPPHLSSEIPSFNIARTTDQGLFVQAIYDYENWRFNGSIRADRNSVYGTEINPRAAVIYHSSSQTTYKFIYGEAFQEPSNKSLYGGWNGSGSNPAIEPEKVRNIEFIAMHQTEHFLHDASVFFSHYDNVITSSANVGDRDIFGIEYRGQYRMNNFLSNSGDITGNIFYTYTQAMADQQYDNVQGKWIDDRDEQGDVAPHKVNFLMNLPIKQNWNANLRVNWVSERELFSQNPLRADSNSARADNRKAEAYVTVDANLLFSHKNIEVGLKIENLLEEDYLAPGVEGAGSGDDFSTDNDGFQNSLLPQVNERVFSFTLRVEL